MHDPKGLVTVELDILDPQVAAFRGRIGGKTECDSCGTVALGVGDVRAGRATRVRFGASLATGHAVGCDDVCLDGRDDGVSLDGEVWLAATRDLRATLNIWGQDTQDAVSTLYEIQLSVKDKLTSNRLTKLRSSSSVFFSSSDRSLRCIPALMAAPKLKLAPLPKPALALTPAEA